MFHAAHVDAQSPAHLPPCTQDEELAFHFAAEAMRRRRVRADVAALGAAGAPAAAISVARASRLSAADYAEAETCWPQWLGKVYEERDRAAERSLHLLFRAAARPEVKAGSFPAPDHAAHHAPQQGRGARGRTASAQPLTAA